MKKPLIPSTALFLCLALFSCANPNPGPGLQTQNTYAQGAGGGAILGALLGAGIGALGHGRTSVAWGGAIGGLAGAAAGGLYANQVMQQRAAAASTDQSLNSAIRNAENTRNAANAFNRELAARLNQSRSESADLQQNLAAAQSVLQSLNTEITRQEQNLQISQSYNLSEQNRQLLQEEIDGLQAERRQLQANINLLSPGGGRVP